MSTPLIKINWFISKSMTWWSTCPPLNLIKRTTLGFPWLVTCSAVLQRSFEDLRGFKDFCPKIYLWFHLWFNSSCPRIFKDFRLKIMNIFWENLIMFQTKLFEKIAEYVLFLRPWQFLTTEFFHFHLKIFVSSKIFEEFENFEDLINEDSSYSSLVHFQS